MSKVLRVNMTEGTWQYEDLSKALLGLGGRGLTSSIVATEVSPKCDSLGPENKLVFALESSRGLPAPTRVVCLLVARAL